MNRALRLSALAMVIAFISGCQPQVGIGVISYDQGQPPRLANATEDGEYALYPKDGSDPKVSYYLHRGDALGFKTGETGQIVAVAGTQEVKLPDQYYVWKRRDPNATSNTPPAGSSNAH